MNTVRRHITLSLDLINRVESLRPKVTLSKFVQRGIELALAEQDGELAVPAPTPTPTSLGPATVQTISSRRLTYTNPLGMVPLVRDGDVYLPLHAFCQSVEIAAADLLDEIDRDDVFMVERIEYINSFGINSALAIAARNGIDPDQLDAIEHWVNKQQPTTAE